MKNDGRKAPTITLSLIQITRPDDDFVLLAVNVCRILQTTVIQRYTKSIDITLQ